MILSLQDVSIGNASSDATVIRSPIAIGTGHINVIGNDASLMSPVSDRMTLCTAVAVRHFTDACLVILLQISGSDISMNGAIISPVSWTKI